MASLTRLTSLFCDREPASQTLSQRLRAARQPPPAEQHHRDQMQVSFIWSENHLSTGPGHAHHKGHRILYLRGDRVKLKTYAQATSMAQQQQPTLTHRMLPTSQDDEQNAENTLQRLWPKQ